MEVDQHTPSWVLLAKTAAAVAYLATSASSFTPRNFLSPYSSSFRRPLSASSSNSEVRHVVVVGGGLAGWGAAKALTDGGCRVTSVDALADPTGATPNLSPSGKPVEAGTRGFWMDYPNLFALVGELGLKLDDVS